MGNCLGGKKVAKVMRVDGQTTEFKIPVDAGEVVKENPGHILLDSEAVKNFGLRAKPLAAEQELQPKRVYFLVAEPPKMPEERVVPRRVRSSGIYMSAEARLESLMLSRSKSVTDISFMKSPDGSTATGLEGGGVRLKFRLPKAEVEKLITQSKHDGGGEAAEKIMRLCMANNTMPPAPIPGIIKKDLKSSQVLISLFFYLFRFIIFKTSLEIQP